MSIVSTQETLVLQGPTTPIESIVIDGETIDFTRFAGLLSQTTEGTPFQLVINGFSNNDAAFIQELPVINQSHLSVTIPGLPRGTYDVRIISVDDKKLVYFGQRYWAKESAIFTFDDVPTGTNCETFVLTPNGLPAGGIRGVTQ